jgi:hypothetical protein
VLAGCDQGTQKNEPSGVGLPVVPLHLVAANIGPTQTLPANGHIELAFNRLLLPACVTRQTFVLEDVGMTIDLQPLVGYDPVARIVTITPSQGSPLLPGQTYKLVITTPQGANDVNGLRAIDGALLDGPSTRTIAFTADAPSPVTPTTVNIDFCRDIYPIFSQKCSLPSCHVGTGSESMPTSAAGLALDDPSYISKTAVGRVAQGANTGPRSVPAAPSILFGEDMPIIDATGNSANSWLMYKVLLAVPTPEVADAGSGADASAGADAGSSADATTGDEDAAAEAGLSDGGTTDGEAADGAADAGSGDGGTKAKPVTVPAVDVSGVHVLPFTADTDADRAVLSQYVLGLPMPYPGFPAPNLTLDELERLNLWIAQGAAAPVTCTKAQ